MKKIMLCLIFLLIGVMVVSCTGGGSADTTMPADTAALTEPPAEVSTEAPPEVTAEATAEEATTEDVTIEEATAEETTTEEATAEEATTEEMTTEEVTTEAPFEPLAFEPSLLPAANIAREGYALGSACKTDRGYSNVYLNDGDYSTGFSTPWEENDDPAKEYYFYMDLTAVKPLDSVKLYPLAGDEAGFPKVFDILVSTDGEAYTLAATVTDATPEAAQEGLTVSLNGVEAQFVKLVTRELGEGETRKGKYLALSEFEVYSVIDTASNLILNRHDIWLFKNPDTTQQLSVLYYRDGTAVDPEARLRFATMDASVAAVDENGLITPVGLGETDVYVTDGVHLAVCHVEVKEEVRNDFRVTTFYHSVFAYPEQIPQGLKVLAEGGIEYVEDTRAHDRAGNHISMYSLYLCNKLGMAYSPCDPEGGHGFLTMKDEEILSIVQKYENRAGFYGIYLADEPHEEYMEFAKVFNVIQTYNPHIIPHLNLLPPYNFGGVDEYFTEFAAVAGGNGRMRYLTYDHYPFLWNNGFNTQVYSSLNRLRKAGLHYNADTGFYMQSMIIVGSYPLLDETALRYNATLGMAYGMKNYKWFVALTPIDVEGEGFETGFVPPDFGPADNYEGLIAANKYIKNLGVLLGNSDAIEVYHTKAEQDNLTLPADFVFAHVGGGDAIYTLYESLDGSGQQHVLISNKNFRTTTASNFKIKVQKDVGALSVFDPLTGETAAITVGADGTFILTLQPGQCVAVILPEGVDVSRPEAEQGENLALNKPVFASSSSASFWEDGTVATYFLTDGIPENGGWLSHTKDREAWIKVDLLEVSEVSRVVIRMNETLTKNKRCKDFTVLVSEDGVTYTEVAKVESHDWSDVSVPLELTFDKVNARYIRIACDKGRVVGFGEIEVYG